VNGGEEAGRGGAAEVKGGRGTARGAAFYFLGGY